MAFLRQYEILLTKAKSDLKAGRILLNRFDSGDDELDLETIMFHLQQCAEKLLKALLSFNKCHIVKTHDLEELLSIINARQIEVTKNAYELIPLTEYAVEGRYAVIHDDLDDADKYIQILEELLQYVSSAIKAVR